MTFGIRTTGSWDNTQRWLTKLSKGEFYAKLDDIGRLGADRLAAATPTNTGATARSWKYSVKKTSYGASVIWYNTNVNRGFNIAIMIQYGHGTGTGGYVQGYDFINPAIRPVQKKAIDEVFREVMK
jgi:hypothetical protein